MTVTSGLRCLESYQRSGPLGCLVRMCLESSIWHSTRCLLTWKTRDTKQKRSLFRLAVSMPHTEENESPFWPTPMASSWGSTGSRRTLARMAARGLITEEERRQLSAGNCKANPELWEWLMGYEAQFTKLIPTPTATDYRGGCLSRYWRPRSQSVQVEREREPWVRWTSAEPGMQSPWEDWLPEPELDRVVDGLPNRVDRLKCLGNAVVPQQFYPFFAFIAEIENRKEE